MGKLRNVSLHGLAVGFKTAPGQSRVYAQMIFPVAHSIAHVQEEYYYTSNWHDTRKRETNTVMDAQGFFLSHVRKVNPHLDSPKTTLLGSTKGQRLPWLLKRYDDQSETVPETVPMRKKDKKERQRVREETSATGGKTTTAHKNLQKTACLDGDNTELTRDRLLGSWR